MKKEIFIPLVICLAIFSCKSDNSNVERDFKELRDNAGEEFYNYYNAYSGNMHEKRSLVEELIRISKPIHENGEIKNISQLAPIVESIYKNLSTKNEIVKRELNLLSSKKNISNDLYFLEYLILNDINKSIWHDYYKFEDVEILFIESERSEDSIEFKIFPKAIIKWYNPKIVFENNSITPNFLFDGSAKFKIAKSIDNIKLKGEYVMRNNFDVEHHPFDTTISFN